MATARVGERGSGSGGGIRGVIFDMDGTITHVGAIDFAAMRRRAGVPKGEDIIGWIDTHSDPAERARLLAIVEEEEAAGLARLRLRPYVVETLLRLTAAPAHVALLTRNNAGAVRHLMELLRGNEGGPEAAAAFSILLDRSFTPVKPHPAAIHHICERWGVAAHDVVMVGDSIDDMACGRAAGAHTALIGEHGDVTFEAARHAADHTISCLSELEAVLARIAGAVTTAPRHTGGDGAS
jgi:phosphoglycolate phosphatase-like HAD superfamily hydrolase